VLNKKGYTGHKKLYDKPSQPEM